ncbi:hypothetical protein B296_00005277 [Ensete ventricosum]|uniref:FAD-dependent protein C-terminal domain-containing protein n=1 Tax=Ensete ventricosum TaxID=4639 RepID=A0A427ANG0_ENSVE|nr:hypothetical protein B296_00005277 [Ensete ventricosum]
MSFSKRASRWANSALVVTVTSNDFDSFGAHGPLAGVGFQSATNVCFSVSETTLPPSSYRLGVHASKLHELFSSRVTEALQQSIVAFDKEVSVLLVWLQTRTSSPVQVSRHADTYESTSLGGLYPIGEGAGYAGGIISAAVDGMYCGFAVAKTLGLYRGDIESVLGIAHKNTGFVKY